MAKKTDSKVRQCIDCNADISKRGGGTKRCIPCAKGRADQLEDDRETKDWKKEGMHLTDRTVTGMPHGITIKQKNYLTFLIEEKGYDYAEFLKLAHRDSIIRITAIISNPDGLTRKQATRLISYVCADRQSYNKKLYDSWLENPRNSIGITKKQLEVIAELLGHMEYTYKDIIILANRDGKINIKETSIENISAVQAAELIEYLGWTCMYLSEE